MALNPTSPVDGGRIREGHSRPGRWQSEDTEVGSTLDGGPGMLIRAAAEGVGFGEGGRTGERIQ